MTSLLVPTLQPEAFPVAKIRPSPCTLACPAGINVKGYVSLMSEGRFTEALETIRRRCPLPGICGRVCHHPCEKACRRGRYDDPVAIRALKRFAADLERDYTPPPPRPITHSAKIAVVGSGPAGLTAAYDLRQAGYPVTIFEAAHEAGGMLRYGIADYRLPREILDREIDFIRAAGVEIVTGQTIGSGIELDDLLYRGYVATLLAVGAQKGRAVADSEDALSFLRRVKEGDHTPVEGRVVVIGGGSTAVEAARTALRLGAKSVEILYRRYREELLADKEEVDAAESEGVNFRFLVAPRGRVEGGLQCVQIGLGEPDASGRRRPIEIPGSEFVVPADHVFAAVGQKTDLTFLAYELLPALAGRDRLLVDEKTTMTRVSGLFAAGDAVTGPATVIEAIGAGHRAAESIRHFLEEGHAEVREQKPERRAPSEYEIADPEPVHNPRIHPDLLGISFDHPWAEVERSFTAEEAIAEAKRCLRCGPCGECRSCAPSCTRRHVLVTTSDDELLLRAPSNIATSLPVERAARGKLDDANAAVLPLRARITEERCRSCGRCIDVCAFHALRFIDDEIRLDAALCRGCGLCTAVCPTATLEWSAGTLPRRTAPNVVLACQRRTGAVEAEFGPDVDVVRLRCVGQIDAGLLLDLQRDGSRKILVAGCEPARCRFNTGAQHAAEQIERACAIASALGLDPSHVISDWSPDRLGDPLDAAVQRLTEGGH